MDNDPLFRLPTASKAFGGGSSPDRIDRWLQTWSVKSLDFSVLLILAGTRTAEVEGVSAAGATTESRKYTAIADAELLLNGPRNATRWPLPPLPAGVSPALISFVATRLLKTKPLVLALGLHQFPQFPHLRVEVPSLGPSECVSTGKAMTLERVRRLWARGYSAGLKLKKPLLLAECVPGGTTTAQAVLTGLGVPVGNLIFGSLIRPPFQLKKDLVQRGLNASGLGSCPSSLRLVAAVGDPFQPFAAGLLIGAREIEQKVLLGGGSQMLAVLALALSELKSSMRSGFVEGISLGTTAWLTTERFENSYRESSFVQLIELVGEFFDVGLLGMSTGLHFDKSSYQALFDYELGYVKEGVGAGALALLAQAQGFSCDELVRACEDALQELQESSTK